MKRWFITGTDTEVGKTVASGALLQAAGTAGWRTAGYKPVASGSVYTPQGLRNSDALALQRYSNVALTYQQVNPVAFAEPTAPHIVSAQSGVPVTLRGLSQGLRVLEQQADWIVIEGTGGWLTPLTETLSFADWVVAERLPVILVVAIKLGCINHALLTAAAIRACGLLLAGWVANNMQPPGRYHAEYMHSLMCRINAPLLAELPWFTHAAQQDKSGCFVQLPE